MAKQGQQGQRPSGRWDGAEVFRAEFGPRYRRNVERRDAAIERLVDRVVDFGYRLVRRERPRGDWD
jgi:hypothetical protein